MEEGIKKFWKSIWRLKVPNKVKVFLWRVFSSALPTKAGLHKRKIVDDNLCDQCLAEVEDEVHAIWSCDCIRAVWEAPFAAARTKNPRMNSMCDLVSFIAEETRELEKFAMVTWAVWQRRNELRLKEDNTPIHKVYKFALSLLTSRRSQVQHVSSNQDQTTGCLLHLIQLRLISMVVFNDLNEAGVGVVV